MTPCSQGTWGYLLEVVSGLAWGFGWRAGQPQARRTGWAGQSLMNLDLNAPGQPLALSRIRPVRVLVRNLLSSCSHGAESMDAA
jgi:hypothetical protein